MTRNHKKMLWVGFATSLAFTVFNFLSMIEQIAGMNNSALATRNSFYIGSAFFVAFSLSLAFVRQNIWFGIIPTASAGLGIAWILNIIPNIVPV